jgi:hypothetical protein
MRKALIAVAATALAVTGLATPATAEVVVPSPLATVTDYAPGEVGGGVNSNDAPYWESEGVTCEKVADGEGIGYAYELGELAAGQSYTQVIVKAGAEASVGGFENTIFAEDDLAAGQYVWADTNGDGLYNPGGEGGDKGISHVIACWEYNVLVTKDAAPEYTRTWAWSATKGAFNPVTRAAVTDLLLAPGQSFNVEYDINLSAVPADSAFKVTGNIVIDNPSPFTATVTGVSDILSDGTVADVVCPDPFSFDIPAGGSVTCTYSADLADATDLTNTATVTTTGLVNGGTDDADVNFGEPTTLVDECVMISDLIQFGADADALADYEDADSDDPGYSRSGTSVCVGDLNPDARVNEDVYLVAVPTDVCGPYLLRNTLTVDGQPYVVDIDVTIPCDTGCTLTQGYWKTHSSFGPAPYDDGWLEIGDFDGDGTIEGAAEQFFGTATWLATFNTPPAGNQFYVLAHQWMAATLNIANGASSTAEVDAALAGAEALFNGDTTLTRAERTLAIGYAATLDGYNNGLTGPGHCDQ